MTGLNQNDFDWMRGMLAGRSPQERERMKAVVERLCADFDQPRPGTGNPELTGDASKAIVETIDGLAEVRAMLFALDMACGDVGDGEAGDALQTIVRVAEDRLLKIRQRMEALRDGRAAV